jgi:hypothetical protein
MKSLTANPELETELHIFREQVEAIKPSAEALIRNLTRTQLLWKPKPEAWSISQCLDHLVATARSELPMVHRAIAAGRSRALTGHGPYRYSRIAGALINLMGPTPRLKFKSPRHYLPADTKDAALVTREFFEVQDEILDCISKANGLHLARTKVSIFGYKYFRLSLGQEFKLFIIHEQRHMLQAHRIKEALKGDWPFGAPSTTSRTKT